MTDFAPMFAALDALYEEYMAELDAADEADQIAEEMFGEV